MLPIISLFMLAGTAGRVSNRYIPPSANGRGAHPRLVTGRPDAEPLDNGSTGWVAAWCCAGATGGSRRREAVPARPRPGEWLDPRHNRLNIQTVVEDGGHVVASGVGPGVHEITTTAKKRTRRPRPVPEYVCRSAVPCPMSLMSSPSAPYMICSVHDRPP